MNTVDELWVSVSSQASSSVRRTSLPHTVRVGNVYVHVKLMVRDVYVHVTLRVKDAYVHILLRVKMLLSM